MNTLRKSRGNLFFSIGLVFRFLWLCLFALLCGFGWFASDIRNATSDETTHTDAVIALTGGSGRIAAGVNILKNGLAEKLFISGVNPGIENGEIARLNKQAAPLFACCIVLGRNATDTIGNAEESAAWLHSQNYNTIRLVTSDYHMPRALLDFRRAAPGIVVIPNPIHLSAQSARLWPLMVIEYSKYLVMLARITWSDGMQGFT